MTFTASIDPKTLIATMREANPVPPSGTYLTAGRFIGRISATLDRIESRWLNEGATLPVGRFILESGRRAEAQPHCSDKIGQVPSRGPGRTQPAPG